MLRQLLASGRRPSGILGGKLVGLALGLCPFALGLGCERQKQSPAQKLDAACAAYCGALGGSRCPSFGSPESCAASCGHHTAAVLEAACSEERLAYLDCATEVRRGCAAEGCSAEVCLEEGRAVPGCTAEYEALEGCLEPCSFAGTHRVAERRLGGVPAKLEAVRAGCGDCPKELRRGAAPGSACQSQKVCEQYCCACDGGRGRGRARFLARACVDGRCASRAVACEVSESELGEELCSR